jgi:tetratricopeptide (TPR) repeat protein
MSRRRLTRFAIVFINFSLLVVWTARAGAQDSSFAPSSGNTDGTVSMRELQIPSKARGDFQRGLQRLLKQDPGGSLRHFDKALHQFPNYYEVYYHEGIAEMLLGRNEEALQSFQKAVDLSNGSFARAEFGYGLALCRKGNATEAERVVRHGLQTAPNIADGHVVLGIVLTVQKRMEEAEKSARTALQLNGPDSGKAYLVLADIDANRGDYQGRVRNLEAYLKLHPDDQNRKFLLTARDTARKLAAEVAQKSK